jgi:hypothetical protein
LESAPILLLLLLLVVAAARPVQEGMAKVAPSTARSTTNSESAVVLNITIRKGTSVESSVAPPHTRTIVSGRTTNNKQQNNAAILKKKKVET